MDNILTPAVSVIIPVYNAEKYLHETLKNVCSQTLNNIEIYCIDDGSTDDTQHILQQFALKDGRIHILTQKQLGSGKARNLGLKMAKGEFIAFMDSDDLYPDAHVLEYLYTTAKQNNAKIAGGGISVLTETDEIIVGEKLSKDHFFSDNHLINYWEVQYDYGFYRYIYARDLLKKNQIFFPDYLRFQDPPFLVKAMLMAGQFYGVKKYTYLYRQGHKKINWNYRRVNDLVKGITDNLRMASEHDLRILHENCLYRLNKEYLPIIEGSLRNGNRDLPKLLYLAAKLIRAEWTEQTELVALENYLAGKYTAEQLQKLSNHLHDKTIRIDDILHSTTWQVGRVATYVPRKAKGFVRCYKQHGLKHTMRQSLVHLGLKEPKDPPAKK